MGVAPPECHRCYDETRVTGSSMRAVAARAKLVGGVGGRTPLGQPHLEPGGSPRADLIQRGAVKEVGQGERSLRKPEDR